jgi:hypothetical protein
MSASLAELRHLRQETFAFGSRWRITDGSKRLHRDVSLELAGAVYAAGEMILGPPIASVLLTGNTTPTIGQLAYGHRSAASVQVAYGQDAHVERRDLPAGQGGSISRDMAWGSGGSPLANSAFGRRKQV